MNHRKQRHFRGFTFGELIVVILIAAGLSFGGFYPRHKMTTLPTVVTDSQDAVIARFEERIASMVEALREAHAGKGEPSWHRRWPDSPLAYRFMNNRHNYFFDVLESDSLLFPLKAKVAIHTEVLQLIEKSEFRPRALLTYEGFVNVIFRYDDRAKKWELVQLLLENAGERYEQLARTKTRIGPKLTPTGAEAYDSYDDTSALMIIKPQLQLYLQQQWLNSLPQPD